MKVYNKSLDFTLLALAAAANGEAEKSARLMLKAAKSPDVKRAVAVLEASNAQAFAGEQAAIKAAAKPAPAVKAAKRVAAKAAPVAAKTKVKAFDMGDEAEIDGLIGDEDGFDETGDEDEAEEVVEGAEEDEGDDDFEATFASVLKGLGGKKR